MITEGYMLKYLDAIWAVKGCYHPTGYAVAVPRVYKGRKIKKMKEALELVLQKFPFLFKYVEEVGFKVPLVPLKDSEILDPFNKIVKDETAIEFIKYFKGKIGVTGSMLYSNSYNDMDFLSTNEDDYQTLLELRKKGITSPLKLINESEVEGLNEKDFLYLKGNRVLEGVFKGVPYTFKIVKCEDFGVVEGKEKFDGIVEVIRAEKPYSIPVKYYTDKGVYLTSFRIRYTELKEGVKMYINGILLKRNKFLDLDLDLANEVKIL